MALEDNGIPGLCGESDVELIQRMTEEINRLQMCFEFERAENQRLLDENDRLRFASTSALSCLDSQSRYLGRDGLAMLHNDNARKILQSMPSKKQLPG